jgi:hypothetical protein
MRWVKDRTGRFPSRPHYLPAELDFECENLIGDFLLQRHGRVEYPASTDDLTVLIEALCDDLDLYADLSGAGSDVEGVTTFSPGRRPKVQISKRLSLDPHMVNRFRTTLTHELGHVKFHAFMFEGQTPGMLFAHPDATVSNKCKRDNMLTAPGTDWMEWQAGYACGALLMPTMALRSTIRRFLEDRRISVGRFESLSAEAQSLITTVSSAYDVSREAARVRLLQQGALSEGTSPGHLF